MDLLLQLSHYGYIGDITWKTSKGVFRRMKPSSTHGSLLFDTLIGVFLKMLTLVASSPIILVDSSRSLATLVANLPVSF